MVKKNKKSVTVVTAVKTAAPATQVKQIKTVTTSVTPRKKSKKNALTLTPQNIRKYFVEAMMRPDLLGPFRQPRFGGSTRTGLGIDESLFTMVGHATNICQILQAGSIFNSSAGCAALYTSTSSNGAWVSGGPLAIGSQFPNVNNVADINIVGCCMVAWYTGNPLNVQGEALFGCCIPIITSASYQSLFAYPGSIKIPIAQLIEKPLVVSFRKLSEVADDFVPVTQGNADVDMPFVATNGMVAGGTLNIAVYRTWEYRSTTSSGNVVPYDKVGDSHARESLEYQDARADIASLPSPVTPMAQTTGFGGLSLGGALVGGAMAAWQMRVRGHMQRGQDNNFHGLPYVNLP